MLTQGELGERAGVSIYTVHHAERGRNVSPKTGRALALALGVDPEELLEEADFPKEHAPWPEENGQRHGYPYSWMSTAFSDLLLNWKKAVEAGYAPEHCRVVAAGVLDAIDAIVPPLESLWNALPEQEKGERKELRRELVELARDAFDVYEQNEQSAGAEGTNARHDEGIREEIRRLTKAIA
jgi:transcriptional regulator with XRE-family HTH domain